MNAAFLLVTSALLVGQPADKKPAPVPVPAVAAASCGNDCGCDSCGPRFRDKFRGLFNRDRCDSCQPACASACHTACERTPLFRSRCDCACQPKLWTRPSSCCGNNACAPATCCDSCERAGFLSRLRERFQRGDCCCDSGCGSGCGATMAPTKTEKIDTAPKKMPDVKDKGKGKGKGGTSEEVRVEPQATPFTPNVIQVNPTAPTVEVIPVPAPAPRVQGDRRDPF